MRMYMVYVDECGYQPKWDEGTAMQDQPVHVMAAVALASENVEPVYTAIRDGISQLRLQDLDQNITPEALGRGQEIKARIIDRGDGFWSNHQELRHDVRKIYLDHSYATYFVVLIDKRRHHSQYSNPSDPAYIGLQYLLERLQGFLKAHEQHGFILIDANKQLEDQQRRFLSELLVDGSRGTSYSKVYGDYYDWYIKFNKVIEIHFGDSKYSIGLQIADFVARHAYSWWKEGKRADYPGWNFIEPRLWKYPHYHGWGYKEFP